MQLSVEILDHVFSFLVSHRETLVACSKDPALSPIVERHLYYQVVVNIGPFPSKRNADYEFEPKSLSELVAIKPRVIHYVRILQIQVNQFPKWDFIGRDILEEAAEHLLMFPVLECIMLEVFHTQHANWSSYPAFQAALKDRLSLPTVKEVHLIGSHKFPLSILDNCKNIKHLTLVGSFDADDEFCYSALPRLKSLALDSPYIPSLLYAGIKPGINELQSLKCLSESMQMLPELLEVSLVTLKRLEIDFRNSHFITGETFDKHLPELSHIPKSLQQLTFRTEVDHESINVNIAERYLSSWALPALAKAINLISSSQVGHLILDIDIRVSTFSQFDLIDFTPLAVLGPASHLIPRIDLYIHTGLFPSVLTRAQVLCFLGEYEDVVKSIKKGILVVHSEKTAPNAWL